MFAAALLGGWVSLHYTWHAQPIDSDFADPVLLWEGIRGHGLAFLKSWTFTPDNWLFTLFPAMFAAFAIFGTSPSVLLWFGWLIFIGCAALTALLMGQLRGRRAALSIFALLLFANPLALGPYGFFSYPVTHNISELWGLVVLLVAAQGCHRRSLFLIWLAGVMAALDGISDPWASAAFTIPLGIAAAILRSRCRASADKAIFGHLLAAMVAAYVLAATRLLGLLGFLSTNSFHLGGYRDVVSHLKWLCRILSALFNVVLFTDGAGSFQTIVNCAALFLIFTMILAALLGRDGAEPSRNQVILLTAPISILATMGAFVISDFAADKWAGRFFTNAYYFIPLLGLVLIFSGKTEINRWIRCSLAIYFSLLAISGLASRPEEWLSARLQADMGDVTSLADFLRAKDLNYGYGPYWGSQANAISWISGGRIIMRPVQYLAAEDRWKAGRAQTSALWYRPEDLPQGQTRVFLIATPGLDGCPDLGRCIAAARRQFGDPETTLRYGQAKVLIWPHPIILRPDSYLKRPPRGWQRLVYYAERWWQGAKTR